jgi:carboxymethylenebutenolidase
VTIKGADGSFGASVADGRKSGPAIVVIQEIFGVTIAWVRAEGHPKAGVAGYCLGGLLAFLTAARTDADAAMGYYGVGINNYLREASKAKKPVLLHIAKEDGFVSKESQAKMKSGLTASSFTLHSYAGRDHTFARAGGKHYHETDAATASKRATRFLRQASWLSTTASAW